MFVLLQAEDFLGLRLLTEENDCVEEGRCTGVAEVGLERRRAGRMLVGLQIEGE